MINKSSIFWYLFIILLFVLLIYITFGRSLNFRLWGDDWVMLWIVKKYYGPGNQFPYLNLQGYAQPWGIMSLLLIINNHFFRYSGQAYYLVSMVLRTLSAFTGYMFLSRFTKSRFMGLIGSLFVLVGFTGIESTNYTIHMNTYMVPMFMFLSLIFLIQSYKGSIGKYLLGCLLFALSLAASPLRSHGLLPFVVIFDILYGFAIAKSSFKQIFFRQIGIVLSFVVIFNMKFFGSPNPNSFNFAQIVKMMQNGDYTFITCFITNLGRAYFPDIYSFSNAVRIFGVDWFGKLVLSAFVIEALIFWSLIKIVRQRLKNYIVILLILTINFLFAFIVFSKLPPGSGLLPILISTFIGIFFLTFSFWALYILFVSKKENITPEWVGMVAGPALILTSLAVPLLTYPGGIYDSNHRYLTLSMSGVAITFASLLKLSAKNTKTFIGVLMSLLLLIIVNMKADIKYFKALEINRSSNLAYSEWNQFTGYMGKYYQKYPDKLLLFYFDDSESSGIADSTFLYGFNLRTALENNIMDQSKIPAFTTVYDEVVSIVTDGKAFFRLGYPQNKIDVSQVYAFKIAKNGDLIDITQKIRKDLDIAVNKYAKHVIAR